ncbi:MAG: bifunctional (p)ppGpp synthetase/guanosine-3',5'-bis(diphosphate) 3'-pyrophosphohydrolase [Xanthomonadales bacterium]|nr:bifunctional (p)ppGpp synthetase/guanosine-3',5'-bis(diphosphate) 3'-pyrophosphohydrolase [Xanthomonadales bacterium]
MKADRLTTWMDAYRQRAGDAAEPCARLLDSLTDGPLNAAAQRDLLKLLRVISDFAPDPRTVSAAMLHVLDEQGADLEPWLDQVPGETRAQVEELLRIKRIRAEPGQQTGRDAEGLRRLLLALVKDVRVVLIALAWQLVRLRDAKDGTDEARQLARETLLIHAPLANRLGVWQLKWELEDLAFRYGDPDNYRRVARLVDERRAERERFIEGFMRELREALQQAGIRADVVGRPKHIYSIHRKMQRKGLDFHELFDVRAVRVLVDDVPTCYSALGLVHTRWQPIPGEFDDYITTPKGNNYQSLHTAVAGPEGKAVEVQIRTVEMHEHAELGVAAHWRYKEGGPNDPAFERKVAVMRQLLDSGEEVLDDESLLDSFRSATSEDRVYALTPKGQVVDLPAGATVLDFAYHIHTEVGHRCRGAKINGRIVPLTQQVATGDRVEILTAKQPQPSRDWLNPRLGFIKGARARAKVRQWFRREGAEESLRQGRELVEAELKRMNLETADLAPVPQRFSVATLDDVYVAVGNGDLTVSQVVHAAERARQRDDEPRPEDLLTQRPARQRREARQPDGGITIEGVGNLMTTIAKCCQPVPGDPVVGYVTRGRGVTIHREDCRQALRWQREGNPRLLEVRWGSGQARRYSALIEVHAFDRRALIRDISNVLAAADVQVTDITSHLDEASDEVSIRLQLRVRNFEQLSELMSQLQGIANVLDVRRLKQGA